MRLPDHAAHLLAHIGVGHIDGLRNQAHAFFMATIPAALHDLVHIIRAVIVINQRNLARLRTRQYARCDAGRKPQFCHCGVDLRFGVCTDIWVVVEHAADGFDGHTGKLCNITDIGSAVHDLNSCVIALNSDACALSLRVNTGGCPCGAAMSYMPLP